MAGNIYDDPDFFAAYARLPRSAGGLEAAAEWPAMRAMLPPLAGARVLDLGCGYGWFCRWARAAGAQSVLGLDLSERMLARAAGLLGGASAPYRSRPAGMGGGGGRGAGMAAQPVSGRRTAARAMAGQRGDKAAPRRGGPCDGGAGRGAGAAAVGGMGAERRTDRRAPGLGARAGAAALPVVGGGSGLNPDWKPVREAPISRAAGLPAMAINGVWNKRCGPGGSARRLHHPSSDRRVPPERGARRVREHGGETGSTRVVKTRLLPGMVPPLSGRHTSANDNEALAVAA